MQSQIQYPVKYPSSALLAAGNPRMRVRVREWVGVVGMAGVTGLDIIPTLAGVL